MSPRSVRTRAKAWETARLKFSDLSPSHLAYPAASAAVASGVLTTAADNAFQPSRPVTGAEAIDAIAKLRGRSRGRAMTALTPANQLTLLRMLLIPAFVILVVYGYLGWALVGVRDRGRHRRRSTA